MHKLAGTCRCRSRKMKESRKISLIYSAITVTLVVMAGGLFYLLSSNFIENLYHKYLSEKAHAVAVERFEKDEMDAAKYRNAVIRRQNSIPTSHQFFVSMSDTATARRQLADYLDEQQIEDVAADKEVFFKRGEEVGTAFVYYDNEGVYTVMVLSRNPYGSEVSKVIGWSVLMLVVLSSFVLYLISRLYAMRVIDRIDRNYRREKMFVNNASHEINNPLTAIQGECDIALMRERSGEDYRRFLQKIGAECSRVIDIMQGLLQLSHARSEKLDKKQLERVDVGRLVQRVVGRLCAEQKQVQVRVEENFFLLTQESLLAIAVRNVVANAVKYSSSAAEAQAQARRRLPVDVVVRRRQIEVRDYGIGIPAADLPHVFEPFFRASNAAGGQCRGHGIGLALASAIVGKLGGSLAARSEEGKGTVFVFEF